MNGFSDWFDNNWVDLARLFVQIGILAMVVRYGRRILQAMRASQEQLGALLRLSVSETPAQERHSSIEQPEMAPPGFAPASFAHREESAPAPLSPTPVFSSRSEAVLPEREQSLGGRVVAERIAVREPEPEDIANHPGLTPWVAAPMKENTEPAEDLSARLAASTRNLGRWLHEPPRSSEGFHPLRRVIRWLQAPAGS